MKLRVMASMVVVLYVFQPRIVNAQQDYSLCEQTVTNANQLAGVFRCDTFAIPTDPLQNREWLIDPQFLWADFASLPAEFGTAFAQSQDQVQGLTVLKIRLTRFLLTGETVIAFPASTTTLALDAPAGYTTNDVDSASRSALWLWRQWIAWGEIAANTSPTLSLDVALADVLDKPAYEAAIAAEELACEEAAEQAASAGRSLLSSGMEVLSEESESFEAASASYQTNFCGGIPVTAISQVATNIRLNWISMSNDTYAVQYADNMEWFNTWHLIGDNVTSTTPTAVWDDVGILSSNVTKRFYRVVRKDASYGLPCVTILSPTNGAVLSSNATIQVYATDDSRVSTITLVVDGNDFATISDGPMNFRLPTTFFSNGVHTLAARVTDNAGMPNLGGDANSPVEVYTAVSEPVQVSFSERYPARLV